MSTLVGAYLCPNGVSAIQVRTTRGGLEVQRTFESFGSLGTPSAAADRLGTMLRDAGIRRARVAVAIRGFGVTHHVMSLPRARDELIAPIAERELHRLEPGLGEAAVAWLSLPDDASAGESAPQRQLLVAGAPRDAVDAVERSLMQAGHQATHVTAVAAAMQRLHEEFVAAAEADALVAPLRDGAFIGFFLNGGLRLAVEPPMGDDREHDPAVLAEEVELGAVFVRQQFRGADVSRVIIAASPQSFPDAEGPFHDRVGGVVERLSVKALTAGGLAALGALLDARAEAPLALAGHARGRSRARAGIRSLANAAALLALAAGAFTVMQALRARQAGAALQAAHRQIEQQSFGIASIRETADQRKLIRDAKEAVRVSALQRAELQRALTAVGQAVVPPVTLDSLDFGLSSVGWTVVVRGQIAGESNAVAVRALNDFYRDLPRRLVLEDLKLLVLTYAEPSRVGAGAAEIHFEVSFIVSDDVKKRTS